MSSLKKKKILSLDDTKSYKVVEIEHDKVKEIQKFTFGTATEIGYSIAVPIVLGVLAGVWLDQKFGTRPKLTLSLLFFGIILSVCSFYRIIKGIINRK